MIKIFVEKLFSHEKTEGMFALIWVDKKSYYFQIPNELDKIEERFKSKEDIYIGIGTRSERFDIGRRGAKTDISSCPGLWIDLDIQSGAHQKENLFKSLDKFEAILK